MGADWAEMMDASSAVRTASQSVASRVETTVYLDTMTAVDLGADWAETMDA